MKRFWSATYDIVVIPLLWLALQILGLFNEKARRGIRGRDRLFEDLAVQIARLPRGRRVWFHSSSMGEFEQAKPIIAELKRRHPETLVLVSFFSPSGYEHSRKYAPADVITYIPFDTRRNARRFLDLLRPDVAVMVRYDVWPNHIWELRRRNIPVLIANATMRDHTRRRLPFVRSFHNFMYNAVDEILTVAESDAEAFRRFSLDHPLILAIGDTRYDQVSIRSAEARRRRILPQQITEGKQCVVIGSSWPEDEEVVLPAMLEILRDVDRTLFIVVPHEPTEDRLEALERELDGKASHLRFSALNEYSGERVLLVDSVGILLILYACAHIAYVGGSFRQGIHNVLEAAVYGIPVLFGPKHHNSNEPLMLAERGGAFVINDSQDFSRTVKHLLEDEGARKSAGQCAAMFVQANIGATSRFLEHLEQRLPPVG